MRRIMKKQKRSCMGQLVYNTNYLVSNKEFVIKSVKSAGGSLRSLGRYISTCPMDMPIIGIMPPECEAANILHHSGLGFIHSESDINGITDTLIRLHADGTEMRLSVEIDHDYISQFSASSFPEILQSVLPGEK